VIKSLWRRSSGGWQVDNSHGWQVDNMHGHSDTTWLIEQQATRSITTSACHINHNQTFEDVDLSEK